MNTLEHVEQEAQSINYLVVGGGGREAAIVGKLIQEKETGEIHLLPGNPGMFLEGESVIKSTVELKDIEGLIVYVKEKAIRLVVIGPEAPLCDGTADALRKAGVKVFGPNKQAARLEGDKGFSEDFSRRHGLPTPLSYSFSDETSALEYIDNCSDFPVVIKYPFLAAGKGVTIVQDKETARLALVKCFDGKSYDNPEKGVVIQEYLAGTEMSVFFFIDTRTKSIRYFSSAQDHKTRFETGYEGDNPMTGGMGTISPSPFEKNPEVMKQVYEIGEKLLTGLLEEGIEYQGVLFAGLMVTPDGTSKVLEFNVRFGDPEIQSILARMKSRLGEIMLVTAEGRGLSDTQIELTGKAITLVLADRDYPIKTTKGQEIKGLDYSARGVKYNHAGTQVNKDGTLGTGGGRVLGVTAHGDDDTTFAELNELVISVAENVTFSGEAPAFRRDIGLGKD